MESTTEVISKGHEEPRTLSPLARGLGGRVLQRGEDTGTGQTLCPDCAQVADALHVCGLGPESLRELFDTLRVIGPSEVKAKMEALRVLGVRMDMQERSQLN